MAKISAERLKKLLANPGERSKLSDAQLTPELRKKRDFNKRWNAEVAPGLTYGQVAQQAKTNTQLKYGGAESDLGDQKSQQLAMAQRDQGFFNDYVAKINAAKAQQAIDTQAAVTQVGQLGQGLDASSAQNWQGQSQAMQADAAKRGATVDPSLGQVAQNAAGVRSGLAGSYGAMLASQGATAQTGFGNQAVVGLQQGKEQQDVRDTKLADLAKEVQALKTEKGAYNVSQRSSIVSDAQDNALKAASTQSLIDSRTASDKNADASRKQSASQFDRRLNKYGVTQGAWTDWGKSDAGKAKRQAAIKAAEKSKAAASKKRATQDADAFYEKYGVKQQSTSAISKGQGEIDQAKRFAAQYKAQKTPKAEALNTLINGVAGDSLLERAKVPSFDPNFARAAIELAYPPYKISKSTANKLHKAGYSVKQLVGG